LGPDASRDLGRDLLHELEEIDRRLAGGKPGKADEKRAGLRRALAQLHRDGTLTATGYDALSSLDALLEFASAGDETIQTRPTSSDRVGRVYP
jgi:hypothetical protein